jgi:tetratricopeptide (TPR) repeat protein
MSRMVTEAQCPAHLRTRWMVPLLPIYRVALLALLCALLPAPAPAHGELHIQIREVTHRIKQHPNDPLLYLKRAELHRAHRDWKEALADYNVVHRLNPTEPDVDFYRGRMLLDANRLSEALYNLNRFLLARPDHASARVVRARTLARLGRHPAAAEDFTRALNTITTPAPELYVERAKALAAVRTGVDAALRSLDEAIGKLGPLITLQLAAVDLEVSAGRFDAALDRIDQITSTTPRKETWLARKGDILMQAKRSEDARQHYDQALRAIEALPLHRRNTRSMTVLEQQLRKQLKQIEAGKQP